MINIVTIGGGTGHSQILEGIKEIGGIKITAICPSTDSGGSTGILQEKYDGSGYTGDLTKCVAALCKDKVLTKALTFRYEDGPLDSHSVKNLLFHALEKVSNLEIALKTLWTVAGINPHRVLPITNKKTELCARLSIGSTIVGETNIDTIAKNPLWNPNIHSISDIYLKPKVSVSKLAVAAIKESDYIIISPGDLYSSIIPVLLPKGMKEEIKKSSATIILILNIMTKKGETDNYTASDFIKIIEERLGRRVNYIVGNNARISPKALLQYSLESKVEFDSLDTTKDNRMILAPLAVVTKTNQIYTSPTIIRRVIKNILMC